VPYLGAALATALIFLMLRRGMPASAAALGTLTVSFGSQAITSPMIFVLRQAMFCAVLLGLWLVHRASATRLGPLQLFLGAACFGLAIFVDVFATIMWPACALFALACCFDTRFNWTRLAAVAAGLAAGLYPAKLVGHIGSGATPDLKWAYVHSNWPLFSDRCLPFALSSKVFTPQGNPYPDIWQAPAFWRAFSLVATGLLVLLWLTPLVLAFVKRIDWPMRRLGLFGVVAGATNIIAFLASNAPADLWSVRYLGPLMWMLPFAMAPLAAMIKPRVMAALLSPYLLMALVGGWLSFGHYVRGPLPTLDPRSLAREEHQVIDELLKRGVTAASAEYWQAYRFTFLSAERLPTVPFTGEDRYTPYRATFNAAKKVALIFDASNPRYDPARYEVDLRKQPVQIEKLSIAGFTVLVVDRLPSLTPR